MTATPYPVGIRQCRYCLTVAGAGSRLCSKVPGQVGLVGGHSFEDVPNVDALDPDVPDDFVAIVAAARGLGVDVEAERCDPWFVLEIVRELVGLPELERAAGLRAVNAGATVADRHAFAS